MTYKLFIDDERHPPIKDEEDWTIARSSEQAKQCVERFGVPAFISFDHDLGGDDTSMVFIHWLIEYCIINNYEFPTEFYVHSQNPVGSQNIHGLMASAIKFFKGVR